MYPAGMRGESGAGAGRPWTVSLIIVSTLAVIFGVSFSLVGQLSVDLFTSDAAQSLSVTDQILAGQGVTTLTVAYPSQIDQGLPARQTIWPPGIPLLAALVARGLSIDPARAIGLIGVAAHALTALTILVSVATSARRPVIGAAFAIGWIGYWIAWPLALSGMSEPLFILAVTLAAACVAQTRRTQGDPVWWFLAAMVLAAAVLTRYLGVLWVAALGAAALVAFYRARGRLVALAVGAAVMLPAALAVGIVVMGNLRVTGTVRGGPTAAGSQDLTEVLFMLGAAVHDLCGLEGGGLKWVYFALALGAALFILIVGRVHLRPPVGVPAALVTFVCTGAILTLGFAFFATLKSQAFILPSRYLLSIGPPVLILIPHVFQLSGPKVSGGRAARARPVAAAVGLVSICLLFLANARTELVWFANHALVGRIDSVLTTPYDDGQLRDVLLREASLSAPLLSNRGQPLYAALRVPTVEIPLIRFLDKPYSEADVISLAERYGARLLIVFPTMPWGALEDDVLVRLDRAQPPWLEPLLVTPEVHVSRINPDAEVPLRDPGSDDAPP